MPHVDRGRDRASPPSPPLAGHLRHRHAMTRALVASWILIRAPAFAVSIRFHAQKNLTT